MIRLIAVAFALAVATSAQAMSPAPLHQPDGMITQVRSNAARGCAGMKHSVAARLHPPAAMSAAEWSQATEKPRSPTRHWPCRASNSSASRALRFTWKAVRPSAASAPLLSH